MRDNYDVIVIGGGINGLCAAGYLAKCGLSVGVFEARNEVGTFCDTEEVMLPGVRCNLHASALCTGMSPPYDELELERFGLELIPSHWGYFKPFSDGTVLVEHNYDHEKTCQSIALISQKDAETFRKIGNYLADKISDFMHELYYVAPNPESFARMDKIMKGCPGVPANWADLTAYHLADMLFESDKVKCFLYDQMIATAIDPWVKAVGPMGVIISVMFGPALPWSSTARGGSHLVPHSLYRALLHYGGEVYQACPVEKIIVENNEAKGIVLAKEGVHSKRTVMADKAIISDLTPIPTFKWLVGEEHLSPEVNMMLGMYDYEGQVLFTNYWVLNEPLQFNMFDWAGKNLDPAFEKEAYFFNFGMEDPGDFTRLMHTHSQGRTL